MNIDDSYQWDVYDKCLAMGLDPDRISHRERASRALQAEFQAKYPVSKRAAKTSLDLHNLNGLFKTIYARG